MYKRKEMSGDKYLENRLIVELIFQHISLMNSVPALPYEK